MSLTESLSANDKQGSGQIISVLFEHAGGLENILAKLKNGGFAEIVQSWISTGENKPITPEQVHQALGPDTIKEVASKVGLDVSTLTSHLSKYLPSIVDKLSPNGTMDNAKDSVVGLLGVLGSIFRTNEKPNANTH